MKLENVNLRTIIAIFVVCFCIPAICFLQLDDIVKGMLGGYISIILAFLYSTTKGSEAKDKVISDMTKLSSTDTPTPPIGGGGQKNQ